MTDAFDRLKAALADRYVIERELGAGGMATVFLAHDQKHDRKVAIKVMRPELSAILGGERFLREVSIAARLNHPHILALHDSGQVEEYLYYVMPHVEGESLRDKLNREKQLSVDAAISVTKQVGAALDYAHEQGVIHRDIKPENILIHQGEALVADFGIALAVTAAGGTRITDTGLSLGTPEYMSPEQATGERDIDSRSDVYSLGAVVYEMLAGEPPYTAPTVQAVLAKKLSEATPRISVVRETVSASMEHAVTTALAKTPADRFATAQHFVEALVTPSGGVTPTGTMPVERVARHRWMIVGGATAIVVAAVVVFGIWLGRGEPEGPPWLVVVPFENLGSPDDEHFADGLTDEITSRLSNLSGLFVISRTSAMQYKDQVKTLPEIGAELSVDYVLEGTVLVDRVPDGVDQVRIIPQLIRVSDDAHLWSEPSTVELAPGEIFRVHAEMAEEVARALDVTLLEPERQRLAEQPTASLEAWDHYQRGRQFANRGVSQADNRLAVEQYERAVAEDSNFALAYARLAGILFATYQGSGSSDDEYMTRGLDALNHATRLQPDLPEIRLAQGSLYIVQAQYEQAIGIFRDFLRTRPNDSEALLTLGLAQRRLGMWDEALENVTRSVALNPRNPWGIFILAQTHCHLRNYAEAEHYFDLHADLVPETLASDRAWVRLVRDGDVSEAERLWRQDVQRVGLAEVVRAQVGGDFARMWFGLPDWGFRQDLEEFTATTLSVSSARYYLARAWSEHIDGNTVRAVAYYDSVRAVFEPIAQEYGSLGHSALGIAYAGMGRKEDAVQQALRGVELRPVSADGLNGPLPLMYLARTYILVGEYDKAIELLDTLVTIPSIYSRAFLRVHTLFDPLRSNPRFQALIEERN